MNMHIHRMFIYDPCMAAENAGFFEEIIPYTKYINEILRNFLIYYKKIKLIKWNNHKNRNITRLTLQINSFFAKSNLSMKNESR